MTQPTSNTPQGDSKAAKITCSICDKENVPDWDGKDHCITCARDIALTTPDTAEAKL